MSTLPPVEEQRAPCVCGCGPSAHSDSVGCFGCDCVQYRPVGQLVQAEYDPAREIAWTDGSDHECTCEGWHCERVYAIDTTCTAHEHKQHPERFPDSYCGKHQLWRGPDGCWGCAMDAMPPQPLPDAHGPTYIGLVLEAERIKMEHMHEQMRIVQAELGAYVLQWLQEHPLEAERIREQHVSLALDLSHGSGQELRATDPEVIAREHQGTYLHLQAADVMPDCTPECAPHGVCYRGHR